jgi:NAD(P)-dependent dehydrogenase (short-subunit alcohol dehydrogenase family)
MVEEICGRGGRAVAACASVATPDGARAIIAVALETFGTLDGVVNNAGIMRGGYFEDLTPEMWQEVIAVNLLGSVYVTQAAWPTLRKKQYGRVVITTSGGGMFASHGRANYAATKAGLYGLMKSLAYEGREHGILVNAVLPFATTTFGRESPIPDPERLNAPGVAAFLAHGRTAEAVFPAVGYLLSRDCTLSGHTLVAGHGRFATVFVGETRGWIANEADASIDDISEHMDAIRALAEFAIPADSVEEHATIAGWLGFEPGTE